MDKGPQEYDAPERDEQPPTSNQDYDYPTGDDKEPPIVEPDWDENRPIPVYVVERPQIPQIIEWSSLRVTVGDQPVQLIGARRNRTRLVLQNEGAGAVFIGPDAMVNTYMNYKLNVAANYTIEMLHNDAVWARCAAGDSAVMNIVQEFTVELDR